MHLAEKILRPQPLTFGGDYQITADLPANTQFLSPRLFMNNGATAAAIACDCSGVYVETDY